MDLEYAYACDTMLGRLLAHYAMRPHQLRLQEIKAQLGKQVGLAALLLFFCFLLQPHEYLR